MKCFAGGCMKKLRIATRPSKLALAQTSLVADMLKAIAPGLQIVIVEVLTKGDQDDRSFLQKTPSVGFFTSEVEKAVLTGKADIAVHSLKDLPTASTDGLLIAAIPTREDPCDVIVASKPLASLTDLPRGARVGTSSLRRQSQLLHIRPDLNILPIRGNIETRIAKLDRGDYDAIVLAAAGLKRLTLTDRISLRLDPAVFLIAPGQGALAVQVRADASELIALVRSIDHAPTRLAVEAERQVLASLHGGCSIPLGVYSKLEAGRLSLSAVLGSHDGKELVKESISGIAEEGTILARNLAANLLARATSGILACLNRD